MTEEEARRKKFVDEAVKTFPVKFFHQYSFGGNVELAQKALEEQILTSGRKEAQAMVAALVA